MKYFSQAGDTIVEVMISMAILAVVLGVAFASSSQSLRQGTDASNRNAAIQIAEQQIAIIQNIIQTAPQGNPPSFKANQAFCLDNSGSYARCTDVVEAPFTLSDKYNTRGSNPNTFIITCSWTGQSGILQQVVLYYHSPTTVAS